MRLALTARRFRETKSKTLALQAEKEAEQRKEKETQPVKEEVKSSRKSKKESKKTAPDEPPADGPAKALSVPGAGTQVQKWIQRALDMGVPALREEYRGLSKWCPDGMTVDAFKAAQPENKNRCMIIQEEVETIVMLCNLVEQGKLKCFKIKPMSPEEPSVNVSVLRIDFKKDDKPATRDELLSRIRGTQKPIAVHCSAGIGRTGTIVAIEYILECLQHGKDCVDMDKLLKELREQRPWSIQNDLQYLYIHRILLFYFLDKYKAQNKSVLTPENVEKYNKFIEEYDAATR
ncbi:unnamed protein product, partial [Mesorhabditis spiculigera]